MVRRMAVMCRHQGKVATRHAPAYLVPAPIDSVMFANKSINSLGFSTNRISIENLTSYH